MQTSRPLLSPHERALLDSYRAGDLTVAEILVQHDATREELYRTLGKAREPFRRPASARPGRNLLRRRPVAFPEEQDGAVSRLERRLARLLSERIAELEDRASPGRSADPEATAKALALSVSTFATLRRAGIGQDKQDIDAAADDRPLRSLAELRDELYGHLQRISDEERARRGDGCAPASEERAGGPAAPLVDLLSGEAASSGD
ncbi:hypothetical protein [uncultured Enterovirga sp.]|uniref:hypothetical protein n=1 Tax=uncultured Enterovirga sp. TaxID=2026352 RepID=UPI0035C98972